MSEHNRSMARTQGNGHGAYYIRLNLDHPDLHQARGLLLARGACEVVEATEMVHRFMTIVARDSALDLVRRKMGYTVGSPFDGRPWRSTYPKPGISMNFQCSITTERAETPSGGWPR